jgi:hypothetical protein
VTGSRGKIGLAFIAALSGLSSAPAQASTDPTHATTREHNAFCGEQRYTCVTFQARWNDERYRCHINYSQCMSRYE